LVFTVISLPLNYFIVYPIYFKAFGGEAAILGMYQQIMGSVKNIFSALIKSLDLRKPQYKQLAAYGHMGREDLDVAWEKTDKING